MHMISIFRSIKSNRLQWFVKLISILLCMLVILPPLAIAQPLDHEDENRQGNDSISGIPQSSVRLPNTDYTENTIDLRNKVLGGEVKINRTWLNGRWYLNPAWASLRFILDPLDSSIKAIDRAGTIYQRTGKENLYTFHQLSITKQQDGWRWSDLQGNWIDYDPQGRILAYGDPSNVKVNFVLDNEGRRLAVNDHHDQMVYRFSYDNQEHLTSITDRAERTVHYTWKGNQLTQVTDVRGNIWQYGYDQNGQLNQRTDPDGSILSIGYTLSTPAPKTAMTSGKEGGAISQNPVVSTNATDPDSKLAHVGKIIDTTGGQTLYDSQYNRSNRQYTITTQDPTGKKTVTQFDAKGRIIAKNINDQLSERYQHDDTNHMVKYTDQRGLTTTTQYNSADKPLRITYPNGATEQYEYNSANQLTQFTNAKGDSIKWHYNKTSLPNQIIYAAGKPEQQIVHLDYDQYGQPVTITIGEGSKAITQHQTFDANGNIDTYTNASGKTRHYSYNTQGQISGIQNSLQQNWQFQYDPAGYLTKFTNPMGKSTQFSTDVLGRINRITDPLNHQTQYQYLLGKDKRQIKVTNPNNETTTYTYNAVGKPVQITSASGLIQQLQYDINGKLISETDPAGDKISYEYGSQGTPTAGMLAKTIYPSFSESYQYDTLGNTTTVNQHLNSAILTTRMTYDPSGLLSSMTDAAGRTSQFGYNALGQISQDINALGAITHYQYDQLGNLNQLTDAQNHPYQFDYDQNNNLVRETKTLGNNAQYQYNEIGQLIEERQASGQRTHYQYDAAGNLIQQQYFAPEQDTAGQTVNYQYDTASQLIDITQSGETNSHFAYKLDALGRVIEANITYGLGMSAISQKLQYSYDADGNLTKLTYPDNTAIQYQYDKGQLSKAILPNGESIKWRDYQWGLPKTIEYPHAVQTNQYDERQQPSQISLTANGKILLQRQYSYDAVGNIIKLKQEKHETSYQYDALDQLTQAKPDTTAQQAEAYSYDSIGNRIGSAGQASAWQYNQLNQLSQWGEGGNQTTLSYTTDGHLASEASHNGQRHYHYNAAGRLDSISNDNNEIVHYQYDPFGRRISKTVNGETTYFIYSSEGLIAELDQTGKITKAYGWEPDTDWGTSPLWVAIPTVDQTLQNASYHYLITDHTGTPQLAVNSNGEQSWKIQSDAFGNSILDEHNQITLNLRFAGQYYDGESGLSYNYQRDYDPRTGRYIEADPIGLAGGLNTFAYAGNNPLGYIDPTGQNPVLVLAPVAAGPALPAIVVTATILGGAYLAWDWWTNYGPYAKRQPKPSGQCTTSKTNSGSNFIFPDPDDDGNKQKKGKPKSNDAQNQQVKDAANETKLTESQRYVLRRIVEEETRKLGYNHGYKDILRIAKEIKNNRY